MEYTLTQIFGTTVYKQVLDTIEQLNLVPYRISSYIEKADKEEKMEAEHRANLQKYGLLKRFESSVEAIKKSIVRLIEFHKQFENALNQGRILDSKSFHRLLVDLEDEEEDSGRKVVIFTQFVDTAKYIHNELKSAFRDHEVQILTGDSETYDRLMSEFPEVTSAVFLPEKELVPRPYRSSEFPSTISLTVPEFLSPLFAFDVPIVSRVRPSAFH